MMYLPLWIRISGKIGEPTPFKVYNIDDSFAIDSSGVYIFTKIIMDFISNPSLGTSHLFLDLLSIKSGMSNIETIRNMKEKGAKHFLYYSSAAEFERKMVLENIREGDYYKYQMRNYPELSIN